MAVRGAAASFMQAEKKYRKIMGYRDLWTLKATSTSPALPS